MATRKDLLKAHSFVTQRLISALVSRRPDPAEPPLRRLSTAGFASVMIAVVVLAGFGLVGVISGGSNTSWQNEDAVIVNAETGTVYAFIDSKLYPAANLTSARLATGGAPGKTLKSRSLRGYRTENPIGIAQAPRQLPDPAGLVTYPVRVCSTAPVGNDRLVTVQIGSGEVPSRSDSVAVHDLNGEYYLITEGRRFHIPTPKQGRPTLLTNLGFTSSITVADRWLNTLETGPELAPMKVAKSGQPSLRRPPSGDGLIGGFYRSSGATKVDYVLTENGLAPIPALAGIIAESAGLTINPVTAAEASTYAAPDTLSPGPAGMPTTLPTPPPGFGVNVSACLTWTNSQDPPLVAVDVPTPDPAVAGGDPTDPRAADVVDIATLQGALVSPSPGVTVLLTENKRFGIATAEDVAALGYGQVRVDPLPETILTLIPQGLPPGESLSQQAALQPSQ